MSESGHFVAIEYKHDVGYHYAVDRAGRVWECRPLTWQGAHVRNHIRLQKCEVPGCLQEYGATDMDPKTGRLRCYRCWKEAQ